MAKISCISKTIIAVWNSDSALFLLNVHAVSPSKCSQEALLSHIVYSSSIVENMTEYRISRDAGVTGVHSSCDNE